MSSHVASWTNTTAAPGLREDLWRAVVRPERLARTIVREVLPPTGPLIGWVEQVWSLAWSQPVPKDLSALISHPTVHLTLEAGPSGEVRHGHPLPAALLHGVVTERFAVDLPPHGWVVGLHLTPGAAFDLTRVPVHRYTASVVLAESVWPGWDFTSVWEAQGPLARAEALREVAADRLAGRVVSEDGRRARAIEQMVRVDSTVRTVAELAARQALSLRTLQRVCRDHLGVTPKWLLRRARVLDAHELLRTTDLDAAQIADRVGYYDQAHLTRDYTRITGVAPVRLRRERD